MALISINEKGKLGGKISLNVSTLKRVEERGRRETAALLGLRVFSGVEMLGQGASVLFAVASLYGGGFYTTNLWYVCNR